MNSSGKVWMIFGVIIIVIGIIFSVLFSYLSEKQIDQLVKNCEKNGGEAIVEKSGFIITTSYHFECKN